MNEVSSLLKIAKGVVDRPTYKKLQSVESHELFDVTHYALCAALEKKHDLLAEKISLHKQEGKDVFFAQTKLISVPSKIQQFKASARSDDGARVVALLDAVQEELSNV